MSSPSNENQPPLTITTRRKEDIIKIMLATDNHIGYMERDPARGQDAINTFKEILELAVKHDVDFILLSGDLFHENRPSRDCLYRTIALLREYTLSNKPVEVELLSDPDEGKAEGFSFPAINYEDPNLNVGIPVFSIHGNHDDPQGAGPEGALCALDLLSATGLVNYIGKVDLPSSNEATQPTGGIQVKPVLLSKGNTRLAIYGVGNVKDQRMHYELRSNRVRMFMPRDKDNWFNILMIHQNRVKHGPQESVPEGMFDDSINLVVWGHEHDCRIVPEEVAGKPYYITQPGSSVATSLSDGEAIPKKVALLEIAGREFQMTPILLRTVRPFVIEEVVLSEAAEEESFSLTEKTEIIKFLRSRVEALIQRASQEFAERNAAAVSNGEEPLEDMLPLVRLKVDVTGVPEMGNPVRFGQEFQGRVANPKDVLVYQRAKTASRKSVKMNVPELSIDDPNISISERLAKVRVEQLVEEYLRAQELQLIGQGGMHDAVQMFVEKDDSTSIKTYILQSLKHIFTGVERNDIDEDELEEALIKAREQAEIQYKEQLEKKAKSKSKGKEKEAEEDRMAVDSMEEDPDDYRAGSVNNDDSEEEPAPPPKKRATTTSRSKNAVPATKLTTSAKSKSSGNGKATSKKGLFIDDSEDDDQSFQGREEEEEDEEEEEVPKKRINRSAVLSALGNKATKKAAPKNQTTTRSSRTTTAKSTAATKSKGKKSQAIEISD
ncbi:meiotic recombination [Tulasnella sp. 418]|nr:meiotic recombination [Tulasnella sp. 418]